jgi:hypothetical protein
MHSRRMIVGAVGIVTAALIVGAHAQNSAGPELTGVWLIELQLDQPSRLGPAPTSTAVVGQMALIQSSWPSDRYLLKVRALTWYGPYDVDFRAFGFEARPRNEIPVAGARGFAGDSIEIVFNPEQDHGGLELRGISRGDSITGRWYHNLTGGASGTFVMKKTP